MPSSDLDAFDAAWRYLETLARQTTGGRDTDAALAELRRRGEVDARESTATTSCSLPSGSPAGWRCTTTAP